MKTTLKYLLLTLTLSGIMAAGPCAGLNTFAALQAAVDCNINTITFSNFFEIGAAPGTTTTVSLDQPGAQGFTFAPQDGHVGTYMIGYRATCATACIDDAHFSTTEIPAGSSNVAYAVTGTSLALACSTSLPCMTSASDWNPTFAPHNSVNLTALYLMTPGATNQSLTLDVTTTGSNTPEPGTLGLVGGALLGLGLVRRKVIQ